MRDAQKHVLNAFLILGVKLHCQAQKTQINGNFEGVTNAKRISTHSDVTKTPSKSRLKSFGGKR